MENSALPKEERPEQASGPLCEEEGLNEAYFLPEEGERLEEFSVPPHEEKRLEASGPLKKDKKLEEASASPQEEERLEEASA